MKKNNIVKTVAVSLSVAAVLLSFLDCDLRSVGVSTSSGVTQRLIYHFFHANVFHALANAWCLISIARFYDITVRDIIIAYIIAVAVPPVVLSEQPTVGLSAFCFALMGIYAPRVARKAYYHKWMAVFIAAGFILPAVNALIHLYAYLAGVAAGYIRFHVRRSCLRQIK